MKYYAIAEIEVTDPRWVRQYVLDVTRLVEQRGGRYLARTSTIEKIEGERKQPEFFLIIEWPSKETAEAFYSSEEYRPYRQARIRGTNTEFLLVAGEDINHAATMLD